jgi:hypothetical protein
MRAAAVRQPFFSCARQCTFPEGMMLIPVKEKPVQKQCPLFQDLRQIAMQNFSTRTEPAAKHHRNSKILKIDNSGGRVYSAN